ncbi:MAG: DUF3054 domain-containing protein [Acidimicrobiia bacterium]|nr:DUF3054 domain-containing protein [Acidimicrobiia bacterium]MBT8247107.1 DUF3054 domain-containing protein [Acidimicrobiia bacterium]NNF87448.1 DUF3054 domain-containing protein [Acidimicrobiia bacterium]NNJ46477.1 DUF3054 domain-containing protein [Acidimicrobiia bacterium]NNL14218.1 DUF3054 domain-containing protein [Acidimicrobiia bacterium]
MKKWMLSYDLASVLVFVIAGRSNHGAEETATGILHTAGPFLIALGIGWVVTKAWQDPSSLRVGAGVLATTVIVGMLLRRFVFDDGTEFTFVLVATAFLALFLFGWRVGAGLAGRRHRVDA